MLIDVKLRSDEIDQNSLKYFHHIYHLQGSAGFRSHASRVITVFDEAVATLNDDNYLAALENIWSKIGESHNKRNISRQAFNVSTAQYILYNLFEMIKFTMKFDSFYFVFLIVYIYRNYKSCLFPFWTKYVH